MAAYVKINIVGEQVLREHDDITKLYGMLVLHSADTLALTEEQLNGITGF